MAASCESGEWPYAHRYAGTPGTYDATTPTTIRHSGADQSSRRATALTTITWLTPAAETSA